MENTETIKYFFPDSNGDDGFFIQLEYEPEIGMYFLFTSFLMNLNNYIEFDRFSSEITLAKTVNERITKINQLAKLITSIDELRKHYLPKIFLDGNGKYSEEKTKILLGILKDSKAFNDFSVFSERINQVFFYYFKMLYSHPFPPSIFKKINLNIWCELIHNSEDIKNEYIEYLSTTNEFYYMQDVDSAENFMDYYLLVDKGDIKLIFNCKTPNMFSCNS